MRLLRLLSSLARAAPQLVTMQLEAPSRSLFQSLFTPHLRQLQGIFAAHGHEIRLAGGAVRDILAVKTPHDLDFATTATPDEMIAMFNAEGVRMINSNGLAHGTVTVRIGDAENFEVTTLRVDRETDGRHATVEFTRDWAKDAGRRDLTVNSMFLDLDGTLHDYYDGRLDLASRRVRFVGVAAERIREDYLRILRFFRFHGRLAEGRSLEAPDAEDAATLAAIAANAAGLAGVSGERLWLELRQILSGGRAAELVGAMTRCGVTEKLGLPAEPDIAGLRAVSPPEGVRLLPATCLAALLRSLTEVETAHARLRLSNEELGLARFVVENRTEARRLGDADSAEASERKRHFYQDLAALTSGKDPRTRQRFSELLAYLGEFHLLSTLEAWWPPKFPVSGHTIVARWGLQVAGRGPILGRILDQLRLEWRDTRFTASEDALLSDEVRARVLGRLGLTASADPGSHPPPAKKANNKAATKKPLT